MRPLNYITGGVTLGHYATAQRSGTIANSIAAGSTNFLASVRWSDATRFMVLMRVKIAIGIVAANTTSTQWAFQAMVVRGFSVDFTVGTALSMVGVTNTNKMRASMGASLMGASGPRIATTGVQTGQTLTQDTAPIAIATLPLLVASTATGTAVALGVGVGSPMTTLYEWTGLGQHPLVLAANEGVVIQPAVATPSDGSFTLTTQWEWAEVAVF